MEVMRDDDCARVLRAERPPLPDSVRTEFAEENIFMCGRQNSQKYLTRLTTASV
jgi:hypothetical protein